MQYCDMSYLLLFLPLVMLFYSLVTKEKRWIVLLVSSYLFFYLLSGKLLVYLVLSTFSIHHFGLWLHDVEQVGKKAIEEAAKEEKKRIRESMNKRKRNVLILGIFVQIGMLSLVKYLPFFCFNINQLFEFIGVNFRIKQYHFLAPIGISFYTLMALSYLIDVYRGKCIADKNLGRLALYLAFFPQIMEGPIARYHETALKLYEGEKLHYQTVCFGMQRILFGLLKKMVIADRLNIIVENIFSNYATYNGGILFLGIIFYTIELYMDFSGVMDVVIGSAEIFNIALPENFRQPFFSKSISDFWSRWHITLGTWFKEYIFYPISLSKGSKKMTSALRKKMGNHFGPLCAGSIALLCVWLLNGLWHGAGYHYIFFGIYHFTFILLGNVLEPLFLKFYQITKLNRESKSIHIVRILKTTVIVFFGELFFKAPTLRIGFIMFKRIFATFTFKSFTDGFILKLGLDGRDFIILGVTLFLLFLISILHEKNISLREEISKKPIYIRWLCYYALLFYIIIFGAYGAGYIPVDPMYANF